MPSNRIALRISSAESLCDVRDRCRQALERWAWPNGEDVWDITMAISELVANAIIHGAMPVRAVLAIYSKEKGHEVVFRVTDARPDIADTKRVDFGRGISIVRALVDQIGVDSAPNGKTVWFTKMVA
jgi:anti-sigma regulatory factor (Ser/Thr protein kinase)